jgi:drug/metabolite transporter (DMT)-like permease
MITIVLGLATALTYGFADFFGAIGSRRLRPLFVTALAAFGGLIFLSALSLTTTFNAHFDLQTLFWGTIGGIFSAIGLSCLYGALAIGPIAILSPLSAVISAIVPAIVGVFLGDAFTWLGWLAIALVLIAVVLVGFVPGETVKLPSARGLALGVGAGLGIGVVLIAIHQAPVTGGLGVVILIRAINGLILITTAIILMLRGKANVREFAKLDRRFWLVIVAAGFFDALANVLFLVAVHTGTLTVISVLTALYPLGTILLAYAVLKERIALSQLLGIALALVASVLLAL